MIDPATLEVLVRRTIQLAHDARAGGDHPFGSLLADADGRVVVEAGNTVCTARDATGHAETNVVRLATARFSRDELASMTLVTSTEPCPMCAGAIFWSGIGTVVFALGDVEFYRLVDDELPGGDALLLHAAEVLGRANRPVTVIGPMLEDEALAPHRGFWRTLA